MAIKGLPTIKRMQCRFGPDTYCCTGFGFYAFGDTRQQAFAVWREILKSGHQGADDV